MIYSYIKINISKKTSQNRKKSNFHSSEIENKMNQIIQKQRKANQFLTLEKQKTIENNDFCFMFMSKQTNFLKNHSKTTMLNTINTTNNTILFTTKKEKMIESNTVDSKNIKAFDKSTFAFVFFRETLSRKFEYHFFKSTFIMNKTIYEITDISYNHEIIIISINSQNYIHDDEKFVKTHRVYYSRQYDRKKFRRENTN